MQCLSLYVILIMLVTTRAPHHNFIVNNSKAGIYKLSQPTKGQRLQLGCSWLWHHRSKDPIMSSPGHTAWMVPWLSFSVLVRCRWEEPVNHRKNCTSPCSPSRSASSQSWTVSTHLPCHKQKQKQNLR